MQVKPKRDPWQQKAAVHLQEKQSMDELLMMHSRFLQVSIDQSIDHVTPTVA